jgi:hypothetical protein
MHCVACLFLIGLMPRPGVGADAPAEPSLLSVFPLGGQAGKTFRATVRGRSLDGARTLWFTTKTMEARVLSVRDEPREPAGDAKAKKKTAPIQLVAVEIETPENLAAGRYSFRVITPAGISNPLDLQIHREPALFEQTEAHERPRQAQPLPRHPVAVHGRIDEVGQVDYYSFDARQGEQILFQALSSGPLDPGITLYELTGSWFDEDRAIRLAFHDDDAKPYPGLSTEATLKHKFEKSGNYLVRVSGFWGYGGADHTYTLRMASGESMAAKEPAGESGDIPDWSERTWTRKLDEDRMKLLWSRSVAELAPSVVDDEGKPKEGAIPAARKIPIVHADAEPTQAPVVPPNIPLPALIAGTLERPGDIDRVTFSIKEGDRLVLEVDTPEKTVPEMNPYLRVVDDTGVEAFTNIFSNVNANGNIGKQIHPKTAFSFSREGEFTLEIRDITASYGDRGMKYRVLVRPQVPHLGEVHITEDHVNLVAGEAKKLTVVTDQEEGYNGFVVLSIDGLPEGVRAVTGTEVEPDSPPPFSEGKKERYTTKSQKATFVLLPGEDAPATQLPATARVYAQPVVDGKLGDRIPVKDLLVMVTRPPEAMSENTIKQSTEASR